MDCCVLVKIVKMLIAEGIVDKAMELDHFGGTYGGTRKPTKFLCLTLKMLQIQPEKDIIVEFIRNEEFKYVRLLGAFYLRLVGRPVDIFQYLEPLYNDYRKVRFRNVDGKFTITHIDEFIESLLYDERALDIALPRLPKRHVLEYSDLIEPRKSVLDEDDDDDDDDNIEAFVPEVAMVLAQPEPSAPELDRSHRSSIVSVASDSVSHVLPVWSVDDDNND
eukprot:c12711_g6_i1.p1 GENE.c12711_g6_i1~~c12711_g6_i1.p1  ORF type:complete len:220 (+),score=55.85 c12711_g6_i1:229-888(+)